MKVNIIARKVTLKEDAEKYIEKRLSKLDKFFKSEPEARVVTGLVRENAYLEVTISENSVLYRAEITNKDVKAAADEAVDIIERQIRKHKTKLEKKLRDDAFNDKTLISGDEFSEDDEEIKIVKHKIFDMKPMTAEDAVLQMQLLGHNFFVFINIENERMNVVYRRKDGNYALIDSK